MNYICKTNKKLTMSRVILKPKETPHEDTDVPPTGDENSTEEATDYEGTDITEPPQRKTDSPSTQTLPSHAMNICWLHVYITSWKNNNEQFFSIKSLDNHMEML